MKIAPNEQDEERWRSRAKYIKTQWRDLYEVNCWMKALERDRPMSFITQITCLVVDQKLRGLEAFEWKCLYIETIYWLLIRTICIHTYNWWASTDCCYDIKLNVNRASTIFSPTFSANKLLHSHIISKWLYWQFSLVKRIVTRSLTHPGNEHQWLVNNFWFCESDNKKSTWSLCDIIKILAGFKARNASIDIATIGRKWASTEHQQFLFLHLGSSNTWLTIISYNQSVGCLDG